MFCDCFRSGTVACCSHNLENRYAVVPHRLAMDYMVLFGDWRVSGVWKPGDDDALRRPHDEYAPKWSIDVRRSFNVNVTYDVILWNVGHHSCRDVSRLDATHAALQRAAPRVVFLTTIGLRPCPLTPSVGDVFNTSALSFNRDDFWDHKTHLHGEGNRRLATRMAKLLNLSTYTLLLARR